MDTSKRNRTLILAGVIGFTILVIGVIVAAYINQLNDNSKSNAVYISNLDSCSKNMQKELKDSMRTNMYTTIKAANDYNKKETPPTYEAVIREGTCEESSYTTSDMGTQTSVKKTTAILDIPDAQQSWNIEYHWMPNGDPITTDLGEVITPSCLEKDKLIYGEFNCEKVMTLRMYGTDKPDPILRYMPYAGKGFRLSYNPDTKAISAIIEVRASQKDNQKLINNLKGQVEYWFSYRQLDINNYTVTYVTEVTP